jgi:catechol 2,3-dioxygenase-like lactoylglutathione lyase family enzyme
MTLEAIDHVQLAMPASGEDAARAFYGALLGLPETPKPADLAARGGCWFETGALKVHLGVETPFNPARKAHIAFRVDNVADLARRARENGFEVIADSNLPGHDRVFIFDPFGNRLEFLKAVSS